MSPNRIFIAIEMHMSASIRTLIEDRIDLIDTAYVAGFARKGQLRHGNSSTYLVNETKHFSKVHKIIAFGSKNKHYIYVIFFSHIEF